MAQLHDLIDPTATPSSDVSDRDLSNTPGVAKRPCSSTSDAIPSKRPRQSENGSQSSSVYGGENTPLSSSSHAKENTPALSQKHLPATPASESHIDLTQASPASTASSASHSGTPAAQGSRLRECVYRIVIRSVHIYTLVCRRCFMNHTPSFSTLPTHSLAHSHPKLLTHPPTHSLTHHHTTICTVKRQHTPPLQVRYDTPSAPDTPGVTPQHLSESGPIASQRSVTFVDRTPTAESVMRNFPQARAGDPAYDANRMAMQMLSQPHSTPLYAGEYQFGGGDDDGDTDDEVHYMCVSFTAIIMNALLSIFCLILFI